MGYSYAGPHIAEYNTIPTSYIRRRIPHGARTPVIRPS
jgi:hypothetical protein